MNKLKLTQGKYAILDKEDYENLKKFKWHYGEYGKTGYAKRLIWDKKNKKSKIVRMHHFVLPLRKGYMVDHINGNGIDNRRNNLRLVTKSQNMMNSGVRKNSTTKVTGVSWHKQIKRWRAYISINKKQISLGTYLSLEEAIKARLNGENKFHKTFAFHSL